MRRSAGRSGILLSGDVDAEVLNDEVGAACERLCTRLDCLDVLSLVDALLVDQVLLRADSGVTTQRQMLGVLTEEVIQVGIEVRDVALRSNEREHLPVRVWAFLQRPGMSSQLKILHDHVSNAADSVAT